MKQERLQRLLAWSRANPAIIVGLVVLLALVSKPENVRDLVEGFLSGRD